MKKPFGLFLLFLISVFASLGQTCLLEKKLLHYRDYPVKLYIDSIRVKRAAFAYLDSIEVFEIKYKSDSLSICGLLAMPAGNGFYPCIIYNRGGNRDFGNLKVGDAFLTLSKMARKGYVVIASSYRGTQCSGGKDEFGGADVSDVLNLVNVLKEISSADTSRIGMFGLSRGGMMTYISLRSANFLKAAVVIGAPSDLTGLAADRKEMEEDVFKELVPDYAANKEPELNKRSAIKWPCDFSRASPVLILHGEKDWRVPVSQSKALATELSKCNVPHKLVVFKDGDHALKSHQAEVDEMVVNWFDTYLRSK